MPLPRPRTALGLVLAALAVLVVVLVVEILLARGRTYRTDVDFTVDETVGRDRPGQPLELRVLGDSTAAGVGTDREADALPVLLARRVAARLDRPVHVVGLGVSGARTADVRRTQLPRVAGADVVVIAVGSNDVIHVTPPWSMRTRTRAMLRAAATSGTPVVLAGIPRFLGVGAFAQPLRRVTDAYAGVLRDAQREAAAEVAGVTFVDIAALASPRFRGRPDAMSSDAFHPSAVGYGFWADALAPAVAEVAADPP